MNYIDSIAADCGRTEEARGFREDWELASELERIAADNADLAANDALTLEAAAKALRNNYIGTKLMLMVTELAEAMEELRDHGADGLIDGLGGFGEELTDTHIRLWALEDMLGIHSGRQVASKMDTNTRRGYKHGRQF